MANITQAMRNEFQARGRALRNKPLNRNTFRWCPDRGDPILAKDLTVTHLANIINWIIDRPQQYADSVLEFMIGEAKYRRLEAFASGKPYIVQGDDGAYKVLHP